MKKIILLLLSAFLFVCPLSLSADTAVHIDDQTGFLSAKQCASLENTAKEIADRHKFDILIISSNDMNGLTPEEYADKIYLETDFGTGIDRDGLILSFCFGENRGYCFYPSGIGNKIFTAEVSEGIFENAYPHFINSEDFEFFSSLLTQIDSTLTSYVPPSRVLDNANLLTDEQEVLLKEQINHINETYKFDAVLVTSNDTAADAMPTYAHKIYSDGLYGFGENNDGVLFVVSPTGENYLFSSGYGEEVFTDYGTLKINSHLTNALSSGDYYTAFSLFLSDTELFLREAFENVPFDSSNPARLISPWLPPLAVIIIIIAAAIAAAYIVLKKLRAGMSACVKKEPDCISKFKLTDSSEKDASE